MLTIRIRSSRTAAFGLLVILLTVAGIVQMPADAFGAASAVSIDSPSDGAVVTAGTARVSGTFAGVYDIKLVINGAKQADVVSVDPDGDQSGTWYYDLNASQYGGEIAMRAKGTDASTRATVWSNTVTLQVDHDPVHKPVVTVASPADGATVGGVVTVQVAVDAKNPLMSVQVRINSGPWQMASQNGAYYELSWNAIGLGDKTTAIEAKATDTAGNTGFSMTTYAKTGTGANEPVAVRNQDRAMWIWEPASYNLFLNPGSRIVLNAFSKDTTTFGSQPVSTFYVAVGAYGGVNILEDDPDKVRDFITWAHRNGFQVHALIAGGTTPAYLGAYAKYHDKATRQLERVINYNLASVPEAGFDGVNVDIEPYISPDFKSPDRFLQKQYLDGLSKMIERRNTSGTRLAIGPAIPRWYDSSVDAKDIDWNGSVKWLSEHVQDIADYISIMDYRDTADGSNGIIASASGEIAYAESIGKPNSVVVGVETIDVANSADPYDVTFRQKGRLAMEQELDKVYSAFGSRASFGGIAVHQYDSYRALPSYWGPGSTFWSPPEDTAPPAAVSANPTAATVDYRQITVRYGIAYDNTEVDKYNIYRSTVSGFAPASSNLAGTSRNLTFQDIGLLPDTTYYYKVAAVDARGNIGPISAEASAKTATTTLKPMIVNGMKVAYTGSGANVTLKVSELATGAPVTATVGGRFTYSGGKYVTAATGPDGSMTADSEPIPTGRQVGFMPRTIDAPGYYWAKSYDKPPAASLYPEEGAGLTGLSVSGGTLDQNFSPYVSLYKVNVDNSVYGITVTPAAAAPDASVTVNGAPVASGSASPIIPLSLGRNTVKVEVTERSGTAAVYAIAVFRAGDPGNVFPITEASYVHEKRPTDRFGSASLLEVIDIPGASGGGDRIAFMKADFGGFMDTGVEEAKLYFYVDENVPKSVTLSVDGYAQAVWSEATIDWNNRPKGGSVPLGTVAVTSAGWYAVDVTGFINSRMEGDRTATFRIMDPSTKNTLVSIRGRSYEQFQPYLIVNPSRSAELSGLAISGASLSPAFSADVAEYRAGVTNSVYAVRLTPTAADKYVRIAVNGAAVPSGRPSADVPLQVGDNPIAVNVTAQNGQSKTYYVTVTRAANSSLSGLTLSEGRLAPAFSPERTTYTVDLFAGVPKIKITPVTADEAAAVTVNGEPVARGQASGEIKLKIGGNTVTTVVAATDGTTTAYTLQVNRIPPGQQNHEEP
ncbi:DNRLRE domain-containing protein [Paenibacillus hemerocallicola]|uniref:DNRLRE domain-containing protein n=1 Tax=Paenibacillus hemerocallicola TaxID=1172614 RepID=A0A5C4T4X5_9BACL|nr:cadherin-like beta sandwich domain-containing protein [Paenibacillus hemerocallicola]TNJ63926.1 DNRLRE domain-containing protein [Paenibacillus hemerocallicola]